MTAVRKVLIADPDLESVRTLSKALRQRGYQVHYAADGSRALELAVLRHPDVVLFDQACPLIEPVVFAQILRTNPRTEGIPVVVTGPQPGEAATAEGLLQKPFDLGEVLARIEEILSRAGPDPLAEAQELEGSFGQLPLPDLLQMLKLNRKSGRLDVTRGTDSGAVVVAEGRPVDASVGTVQGEKALFRLLTWKEGSFTFAAGAPPPVARIARGMDELLLDGLRQADELAQLESSLPPAKARLTRAPEADPRSIGDGLGPNLLAALGEPHTLAELLDLQPEPDLAVLEGVTRLLARGLVRVTEPEEAVGSGPLLGAAEVHALRARLLRGRQPSREMVAKVVLCTHGTDRTRRLLGQLPGLGSSPEEMAALESGLGTVARLDLGEGLRLDFCVLPGADAARPLWRPLSARAVGALLLDGEDDALALASALAFEQGLPVVCTAPEVPPALAAAPAGALAVPSGAGAAVRALLLQALARPAAAPSPAPEP